MRRASLAHGLAGLILALLAVLLVRQYWSDWYQGDDAVNMRWALEYRDQPWAALTGLHSVHDHIRPATLVACWLGAAITDGRWWGTHLVMELLHWFGLAGVGVLAARLSGRPWVGLVAVGLSLSLEGYEDISRWNAWICSAGEIAFGIWGLVAIHHALEHRRWPWLGMLALVVAGLFKEPGWIVYPGVAALMAWSAWLRGQRGAKTAVVWVSVVLGAAGLVLTWHPANLSRASQVEGGLPSQLWSYCGVHLVGAIDIWPLKLMATEPPWSGITLVLAVPALVLALAAATHSWRTPAPALGLAILGYAVMAPFGSNNSVHVLAGAYGMAILVAMQLPRLLSSRMPRRLVLAVLVVGLGLEAGQLATRLAHPHPASPQEDVIQRQDQFMGDGALVQALALDRAVMMDRPDEALIAPLLGFTRVPRQLLGCPINISSNGQLMLCADEERLREVLLVPDRLAQLDPAVLSPRFRRLVRAEGASSKQPSSVPSGQLPINELRVEGLPAGYYAVGMVSRSRRMGTDQPRLVVTETCTGWRSVEPTRRGEPWVMSTISIREECDSLSMALDDDHGLIQRLFVARLPDPRLSFWAFASTPRRLNVHRVDDAEPAPPGG